MPLKKSVDTPPMRITLKATARPSPGSASTHTMSATAAMNISARMPAAPTRTRCHFSWKAEAAEAST